ncbi:hypothetical protein F5Y19DRAFT_191543 [Xylariaceae sp. FL1651]|nr:hypothetical protein F5Y19DRAFT_191543 [Xylariaceae sp. FL1651]
MDKKRKLVFQLDTPYSAVSWPQILPDDQVTILELLCSLLSPLGRYRSHHVHPSKGSRAKKRKRNERPNQETAQPIPPTPELQSYVDVGLSSVSRSLQNTTSEGQNIGLLQDGQGPEERSASRLYSAIFVARSGQPNALSSHLPQMIAVASQSHPSQPPIRLVVLPKACEDRLSESLGIPRISCIGLCMNAPNSKALVDFVQDHVPVVKVPWLDEASHAEHRDTKINVIETVIGARKKTKNKNDLGGAT